MLNLYRKKQSKILESKQMLLVKRFITQHFRQELYSVLNNRNVIRRRLRLTHQWHSRSICKLHIGYSFGSSGVAIWYNSNICNLKKRVSWQTDQTKNEQNRTGGRGFFSKNWKNDDLLVPLLKRTLPSLWAWYSLQAAYKMLFWHLFLLVLYPLRVSVLFYTKEPNMTGSDRGVKYIKDSTFHLTFIGFPCFSVWK